MGFSGNHRSQMQPATTSGSVSALVAHLQTELRSLVTRRKDLVRRIRNVHQVKRGLREISIPTGFTHLCAEPLSPGAHTSVTAFAANRTVTGKPGRDLQSSMQCKADCVSLSLQRACRIALLEAEGPASLEEICTRILRRGSFSFANLGCANLALVQVLNAMTECGEVHLLEGARGWRWERVELKEA
jgi:hypothetical protein